MNRTMRGAIGQSKLMRRGAPVFVLVVLLLVGATAGGYWTSRAARPAMSQAMTSALAGLNSPNAFERGNAVKALRVLGDHAALPALVERVDDPDQAVGLYVAQALGELAAPADLPGLRNLLDSQNADIRWRAAYALGAAKDGGAVDALARLLRDSDVTVQNTAARSLAQIGTTDALNAIANGLGSPQASVTAAAMSALEAAGRSAVPTLIRTLDSSHNALARQNAATTLGYIASADAKPALQLALVDPDPAVQSEAEWALEQIALANKSAITQ